MSNTNILTPVSWNDGKEKGLPVTAGGRLGPYRVSFEIARGGMATVYLGSTVGRGRLHRFVALKCLRRELAQDQSYVDMFFDEAAIASQIHHPNVCTVLDFDVHEGVHFLAMEFLSGQTLNGLLRQLHGRPTRYEPLYQAGLVCRLLTDACEGLHAAHELCNARGEPLNIVHRDVAPDNLFVTYDGSLKVLDFGVASAVHQQHLTQTGMIKGKCSYMAPEVLGGKKPDRRADVWGLGVTAWEMLTHQRLFKGNSDVETFRAICGAPIAPPSSVCATVPPALDAIVLKALDRNLDARYATTRELGRALNGFLVENRLAIGLAEVADTMTELFPEGVANNRRLFEVAEQIESSQPAEAQPITAEVVEMSAKQLVSAVRLPRHSPDAMRWWRRGVVGALAVAAGSLLLAGVALARSGPSAAIVQAEVPTLQREAPALLKLEPSPAPGAPAGSPLTSHAIALSPTADDGSGDLVLHLRVTSK